MSHIVKAIVQKVKLNIAIRLTNLRIEDKEFIADALQDSFVVDDAYYDHDEKAIIAGMWSGSPNIDSLSGVLSEILSEMVSQYQIVCE